MVQSATAIDLCSLAWGSQEGYVCLSVRDTSKDKKEPGYWQDKMYVWPKDRDFITKVLDQAKRSEKDVYWAPLVYDRPSRSSTAVTKARVLYADLDEAHPKNIPNHLRPTAVWESSPGRYQALWTMDTDLDIKYQQELNQRLTYALGADRGGWDTTQVLRTPGTHNHKYPEAPIVRLMHLNGHALRPAKLVDDLPSINDILKVDPNGDLPNADDVLKGIKLNARLKELLKARHATVGDRSERLWELECLLAERGLRAEQIASVVKRTAFNKFSDRRDETRRLLAEATKAVDHVGHVDEVATTTPLEVLEEEADAGPIAWDEFDRGHKAITWLVADIWGDAEVGFISGLPKSYKSWLALDLAVSVATGTRFLNIYQTHRESVLLIQEEDPKPVLQDRLVKIGAHKKLISCEVTGPNTFSYDYNLPDNLYVISNQGFTIDEDWLDLLEGWIIDRKVKLVILDPLMMIAGGGFDEFKAFEFMDKVLKPLKRLRSRTGAAVALVHHHIKQSTDSGARAMYGSVALWAWEEAALHLQVSGPGKVTAERFSKHTLLPPISIEIGDVAEAWHPTLSTADNMDMYDLLNTFEAGATIEELVTNTGTSRDVVGRQLKKLEQEGRAEKTTRSTGKGRPSSVWKIKPSKG